MVTAGIEAKIPLEEVWDRGIALYERLRPELEPKLNGRHIAISVETGDYAIAETSAKAMRAMATREPEAQLFRRKIGLGPELELAARAFPNLITPGQDAK